MLYSLPEVCLPMTSFGSLRTAICVDSQSALVFSIDHRLSEGSWAQVPLSAPQLDPCSTWCQPQRAVQQLFRDEPHTAQQLKHQIPCIAFRKGFSDYA